MEQNSINGVDISPSDSQIVQRSISHKQYPWGWIILSIVVVTMGLLVHIGNKEPKSTNIPISHVPTSSLTPIITGIPTTDWITYENRKLDYSVKIPPNWIIYDKNIKYAEELPSEYQDMVAIAPEIVEVDPLPNTTISIGGIDKVGGLRIERMPVWGYDNYIRPRDTRTKDINGFEVTEYDGNMYFGRNDQSKNFLVHFSNLPEFEKFRPTYEAILASLTPLYDEVLIDIHKDISYESTTAWTDEKIFDLEGDQMIQIRNSPETEINIGVRSPYSTSGSLCANQTCTKIDTIEINKDGIEYLADLIEGSRVVNGEKKVDFYRFQVTLDKHPQRVLLKGHTSLVPIVVSSSYVRPESLRGIVSIVELIGFERSN